MFHPDLSENDESSLEEDVMWELDTQSPELSNCKPKIAYVGWLDPQHPYTQGSSIESQQQLARVLRYLLSNAPVGLSIFLGHHTCEFCGENPTFLYGGRSVLMGSADFQIKSDNVSYLAPALMIHYVERHNYLPPREFLEATIAVARRSS
jgi:hypothetical protein